ncbi:conserved hypothetical protein [Verticillium alfalfae VaMs.102]|uniref:Protein kinase domain-containing protein n=1 Tax=Verticillium alfalfae (strain VaMs.102 / ATCC MYA-4576 / FGSC 10136) TaxID=526221 RepID=C9S5H4_VERA1|nr:conserved hypothetical protein [Verticillium alfalfae VaMs.102]EEY15051.1 conserved hypothetical protein [Verticillium alfalfae VaMs.102]
MIIVMCNGNRPVVHLSEDSFSGSFQLKEKYLFFLKVAHEGELDGQTVDDFLDWSIEPFLPVLRGLPRKGVSVSTEITLRNYFSAETLVYILVVTVGELSPSQREPSKEDMEWIGLGIPLPPNLCSVWQCFKPSKVIICAETPEHALAGKPKKVRPVGSPASFFLKWLQAGDLRSASRELAIYQKISKATLSPKARLPRLHGLVRDESGVVFGLLLSYINRRARRLTCAVKPHTSTDLKQKWKNQVCCTVEALHTAGIIWGVKAANVLIDENDDALVTDFGGGYTKGWVKKESAGSLAGDAEGLANILKTIGV